MPTDAMRARALEPGLLRDMLVSLGVERSSGAITVATANGYGEIRLLDGDIVDAVYIRLEGIKAVVRLLAEENGMASFAPAAAAVVRRMNLPTAVLVDEAGAAARRANEARERVSALLDGLMIAVDLVHPEATSSIDDQLHRRLRVPTLIGDLLDERPESDADILDALKRLHDGGRIKSISKSASVQLCGPDQLHLVRSFAERTKAAGFRGVARLVLAATAGKLSVLGHTVLSLVDARPPAEPAPGLPIPHSLCTLRLGEGMELDVIALPLVPAYAPLWPMALAGAAVTIRIDEGAAELLDEACAAVGVTVLDTSAVFGAVDEASPMQVASLIRTALEVEPQP